MDKRAGFKTGLRLWRSGLYRRLLPADWVRRIDLARSYAHASRAGFVLIHVPRTAGTAIALANYGQSILHVTAETVDRFGSAALKALPKVAVIRDPVSRLVSAYHYARNGGEIEIDWRDDYTSPEFESLTRFVARWLYPRRGHLKELDQVFWPQSWFTHSSQGACLVEHLLSYEDLPGNWVRLPFVAKFPQETVNASVPAPRESIDGETLRLIREIYERDYRLLFPARK